MRAARLHAPGDLRIETVPDPQPAPGEVVLRIAAALSCATDVKSVRRGHPSITSYPSPLGHEFAGVVEVVGDGVDHVRGGDEVFCGNSAPCGECFQCKRGRDSLCEDLLYLLGGFGERVLVPERIARKNLHSIPRGLDLQLAPIAEPLACAIHALDVVDIDAGDSVAIVGAGSLGLMLCALAASAGGRPVVLDPHPERLARAPAFGATDLVHAERGEADVEAVRERTDGRGAALVFEAVGRPEAWELAVRMACPGGTVNLFGGCARDSTFTVPTRRVHYEEVTLLGTYHHAPRYLKQALNVLAEARWPWADLCGPRIGLDELPRALNGELGPHPKFTVMPEA
ncbi:MAG: zinc-binding dehydrogenase [Thermoleophilaceae bacterium]